jgi:hypothetical protein
MRHRCKRYGDNNNLQLKDVNKRQSLGEREIIFETDVFSFILYGLVFPPRALFLFSLFALPSFFPLRMLECFPPPKRGVGGKKASCGCIELYPK